MPGTIMARVNKLAYNEPNQFIFVDLSSCPIGYIEITWLDRDTDDRNKNQSPKYTPHEFKEKEEGEEDPVIPDTNIDLDINHETPT